MSNRSTFVQNRNENHALEAAEDQRQEKQLRPLTRFTLRVSAVYYFQIVTVGGLWRIREMSVRLRVITVIEAPAAPPFASIWSKRNIYASTALQMLMKWKCFRDESFKFDWISPNSTTTFAKDIHVLYLDHAWSKMVFYYFLILNVCDFNAKENFSLGDERMREESCLSIFYCECSKVHAELKVLSTIQFRE